MKSSTYACDVSCYWNTISIRQIFFKFTLLGEPVRRMQQELTKFDEIRRQKVLFQDFKVEKSSFHKTRGQWPNRSACD